MEADGIVVRTVYPVAPPRVEYALSELGKTMCPILEAMEAWMRELGVAMNAGEVGVTQELVEGIADAAFLPGSGYRALTRDDVAAILRESLKGASAKD